MIFKFNFPKRSAAIIKIEEVQTLIYILVLILTMVYGIIAMDAKFEELERRETAKYKTGAPPDKVAGVILVDAPNKGVSDLSTNWRQWMHDVRNQTDRTEVFIITSSRIGWYPVGPIMYATNCSENTDLHQMNLCRFEQGLQNAIKTFPNFKWLIRLDHKEYLNPRALNDFLKELPQGFQRTRILKSAVKNVGKTTVLDTRSGWFMSRRIVYEWVDKMSLFHSIATKENSNIELATAHFIQNVFEMNPKAIADPRFVPHSKSSDDFADMIDVDMMDPCPPYFRYFELNNMSISLVRNAVTWYLEGSPDDRRGAMMNIPRASKWSGYTTTSFNTTLCTLERTKKKRGIGNKNKK